MWKNIFYTGAFFLFYYTSLNNSLKHGYWIHKALRNFGQTKTKVSQPICIRKDKCRLLPRVDWFTCKLYTGCPRRKGPNFGRVFLKSNYTDITQNTYIQSSMVTEILAREKCGLLWCCVLYSVHDVTRLAFNATILYFSCIPTLSLDAADNDDLGYGTDARSV